MKLDIDCKEMSRLISESQELTLPAEQRIRMRLHLVICETCRNVIEQFDFLRRAMRQIDQSAPVGSTRERSRPVDE